MCGATWPRKGYSLSPVARLFRAGFLASKHGPQVVAHQNRFGHVINFVAVFPVHPNILYADIAAVAGSLHFGEYTGVVDSVVFEWRLQSLYAAAAGVEV